MSEPDPLIDPLHVAVTEPSPFAAMRSATTFKVLGGQLLEEIELQVRKLRIPIVVFALFLFCMKFIPIWLFLLCLFFTGDALFPYLPPRWRNQINEWILNIRSKTGCDTKVMKNLREAARALKPFLMTALFFAAAPVAVVWMVLHYVGRLFKHSGIQESVGSRMNGAVVFKQNVSKEKDEDTAFFHSRAFAVTLIAVVGLGMPVAVIMFLYSVLGIGQILTDTAERNYVNRYVPNYEIMQAPPFDREVRSSGYLREARRARLTSGRLNKVGTYEPDPSKPIGVEHFATFAYLMSLGWCLSVLFMRAWITFPLNFASTEYDIEVDSDGVRKNAIKGWFAEFLWYCWPGYTPSFFTWSDVKRIDYEQGGFGRLSPLPATLFSKNSIVYKGLNRLAIATDACVDKIGRSEYISFNDSNEELSVSRIKINLWELSSDDKARLFYAIRTHAPEMYMNPIVQEKLIGSKVLKEARYTEIWFGLLTSEQERKRQNSLNPGDTICGGKYTVKEKIGAGGQAAVFLVTTRTGEELVLKEFILTSADTFGALVESATDFENESSILSRLDHPSVVKFVDIFAEDKRAYIVLEHVKGTTLRREVAESGALSELAAVERGLRMCDILAYLHEQSPPVVHRDFSPENLIKQDDGSLKVIDFSVASRTGPHKSGDCVGKHSYTPPEQFRSQACPQSDIYALGATLHFLVTGLDPKPITMSDPRNQNSNISEKFAAIVMKCTALDLNDRYDSVQWLRLDLEELRSTLAATVKKSPVSLALVSAQQQDNDSEGVIIKMPQKKSRQTVKATKKKVKRQRSK